MPGRIIRLADLPLVPWRNGKGLTRDIATHLAPDGTILAQLGIAELREDAPFSDFAGLDRIFTPIGVGVELKVGGGSWLRCDPLQPVAFDGGAPTTLRLPSGAARAFNVMTARTTLHAIVSPVLATPGTTIGPLPGLVACYCLSGRAGDLVADTVQLVEDGTDLFIPVTDTARLILVQVTRVAGHAATSKGWAALRQPDPVRPG